jgi:DNA polymerase alpha subunit B
VKLNEASVILESSRMMGSGTRIPIKFDPEIKVRGGLKGIGGVGLFPGAIVALKGKNGGGGWFYVEEILAVSQRVLPVFISLSLMATQMPPMQLSPTFSGTETKSETTDSSFSMCIASGPFTPDTDLSYKPWQMLLESLKTTRPAVLLLVNCHSITHPPSDVLLKQIDWTFYRRDAPKHQKRRH